MTRRMALPILPLLAALGLALAPHGSALNGAAHAATDRRPAQRAVYVGGGLSDENLIVFTASRVSSAAVSRTAS